ncbi:MAG: glycerate kinase [Thaumarchaeota archaeon]|nr:glycerate kinase [Nitrososphaerota archaeon]
MTSELTMAISLAEGMRRDALLAVEASLDAAHPSVLVRNALRLEGDRLTAGDSEYRLAGRGRVLVVGGGKASGLMAVEVARILGDRIDHGVVIVPEYQRSLPKLEKVKFARSTHPLPSEKGVRAVRKMLEVLSDARSGDLVIALVSGGGSALMPLPAEGVTVGELELTTSLLLRAGAAIGEINCVRKHLSRVSGGRLVERVRGADVLTLMISDVVGDDPSSVASGPTVPDPTTFADARRALKARKVWDAVPTSVRKVIQGGIAGTIKETPKPGNAMFARVSNVVVGTNAVACSAARVSLERAGYRVSSLLGSVTGEARAVGRRLALLARSGGGTSPWATVWGGETTVTVRGSGVGGRNQEFALAAAIYLKDSSRTTIVSFGTDGIDGATRAAGAIADSTTFQRAKVAGLDPSRFLHDNDSFSFFRSLGDLVVTGPTGTNVNDVMFAIREKG